MLERFRSPTQPRNESRKFSLTQLPNNEVNTLATAAKLAHQVELDNYTHRDQGPYSKRVNNLIGTYDGNPIIHNSDPPPSSKLLPESEISNQNAWQWIKFQGKETRALTSGIHSHTQDFTIQQLRALDIRLTTETAPEYFDPPIVSLDEAFLAAELLSEFNLFTDPRFTHVRDAALNFLNLGHQSLEEWGFQEYLYFTKEYPHLEQWLAHHNQQQSETKLAEFHKDYRRLTGIHKIEQIPISSDHIHQLATDGHKYQQAQDTLHRLKTTPSTRIVKSAAFGPNAPDTSRQIQSATKQQQRAAHSIDTFYSQAALTLDEYFTNNCDTLAKFTPEERRAYTRRRIQDILAAAQSKPTLLQDLPTQAHQWINGTINPEDQANPVSQTYALTDAQIDRLLTLPQTRWLGYTFHQEDANENPFFHIEFNPPAHQILLKSTINQLLTTALNPRSPYIKFLTTPVDGHPITYEGFSLMSNLVATEVVQHTYAIDQLRHFVASDAADISDLLGPNNPNQSNTIGWGKPQYRRYPSRWNRPIVLSDTAMETLQQLPATTRKYLPRIGFAATLFFGAYQADIPQKAAQLLHPDQTQTLLDTLSRPLIPLYNFLNDINLIEPHLKEGQSGNTERPPISYPVDFITAPQEDIILFPYGNEQIPINTTEHKPIPIEPTDQIPTTTDQGFIYSLRSNEQRQYVTQDNNGNDIHRPPIGYKFTKIYSPDTNLQATLTATGELIFTGSNPSDLSLQVEPDDTNSDTPDRETATQHTTPYTPTPDTQTLDQLLPQLQQNPNLAYSLDANGKPIDPSILIDPTTAQHNLDQIKLAFFAYSMLDRDYDKSPQGLNIDDFKNNSQPYPFLEGLLTNPNAGYQCEFSAHAYIDWLTLHGYKAQLINAAPVTPINNQIGLYREPHQLVRIINPDGTITYSDMTPSHDITPAKYRDQGKITPAEQQDFINKQLFLESINIFKHLPEPKPNGLSIEDLVLLLGLLKLRKRKSQTSLNEQIHDLLYQSSDTTEPTPATNPINPIVINHTLALAQEPDPTHLNDLLTQLNPDSPFLHWQLTQALPNPDTTTQPTYLNLEQTLNTICDAWHSNQTLFGNRGIRDTFSEPTTQYLTQLFQDHRISRPFLNPHTNKVEHKQQLNFDTTTSEGRQAFLQTIQNLPSELTLPILYAEKIASAKHQLMRQLLTADLNPTQQSPQTTLRQAIATLQTTANRLNSDKSANRRIQILQSTLHLAQSLTH